MWKSSVETKSLIDSAEGIDLLGRLFALSVFWQNSVYPKDYAADQSWPSLVSLTDYGARSVKESSEACAGYREADVMLAMFGKFFHSELFFDWRRSNISGIATLLHNELLSCRVRLPHRMGRLIYDRFNDAPSPGRTNHVTPEETDELLSGTPQGVYQVGDILSGPLGIIESAEQRYFPPNLRLPLWHCSDTGCGETHHVALLPHQVPVVKVYRIIDELLTESEQPSEWNWSLRRIHRGTKWPLGRPYCDMPALIADCVLGFERTALLVGALKTANGDYLRSALSLCSSLGISIGGAPEEVAGRLSPEAQLQLLLSLKDEDLVALLDRMLFTKQLIPSLGETRRPKQEPPHSGRDTLSELSALGTRSAGRNPVLRLTSEVWQAYSKSNMLNELEWRLRTGQGVSAREGLVTFIRDHGPERAIRDLVLSLRVVTRDVCEDLGLALTYAEPTDNSVSDRLLWKFGFDPPQFDDSDERFQLVLKAFEDAVLRAGSIESEDEKATVRAAGVNLFVSVEEILERLLLFPLWCLASDHFLGTHFEYDIDRARHGVSETLGASLRSDVGLIAWNPSGENTLGTLLRYLAEARKWMQGLEQQDRSNLVRPTEDLPHYEDDPHRVFPFRHLALWADADPGQLRALTERYADVVRLVEQADLAPIRNGLDHRREKDRFPDSDRMLACAKRLGAAFELGVLHGFLPRTFWVHRATKDRFGLTECELRDRRGNSVILYGPSLVSGLQSPDPKRPVLIAPGNLLGLPNSRLFFGVVEHNPYRDYWQGYPRRKVFSADPPVTAPIPPCAPEPPAVRGAERERPPSSD
jgi:hypothetical protein